MKVVFVESVEGSGRVGEIKEVKKGYARNFLLPRGLAVPATKTNLARADRLAKADAIRQEKFDAGARAIAEKIDGAAISFTARVGGRGRLFGSVTAADIAARLSELAGEPVDHRQVLLGQSIRSIGTQEVRVRLTRNVSAGVTVQVEAAEEAGAAEEAAAEEVEPTIAEAVAAVETEATAEAEETDAAKAPPASGDDETSE